jgi:NadR type nicotinamide-nucleotide adenylyltransferase
MSLTSSPRPLRTTTVAVVGPESSGKTTISRALADALGAPWVPEHARMYLGATGGVYGEADLLHIAQGQLLAEEHALACHPTYLVCDTDLVTILVWAREKYGRCDPRIERMARRRTYAHRLLCAPDMPWEPDPLRESPHDRDRLFRVYADTLEELGVPYTVLRGSPEERLAAALACVHGR